MRKPPNAITNKGKGTRQEILPSRHALNTLTRGDPARRTLNQYSKASPAMDESAAVPVMSQMGPRP